MTLVVRAALRLLPLLGAPDSRSGSFAPDVSSFQKLISAVFRAAASARLMILAPGHADARLVDAVSTAADAAEAAAAASTSKAAAPTAEADATAAYAAAVTASAAAVTASAAANAAVTASAAASAAATATAYNTAAFAAETAAAAIAAVNAAVTVDGAASANDATTIAAKGSDAASRAPLPFLRWRGALGPETYEPFWLNLRAWLARRPDGAVWIEWYERIVRGELASPEIEEAYVLLDRQETWDEGFDAVCAAITGKLREIRARKEAEDEADDAVTRQIEAAFRFDVTDGRIVVVPGAPETFDPAFAETLRAVLAAKVSDLLARAGRTNSLGPLREPLAALLRELGSQVADVNDGLLLSRSRTVLALRDTFGKDEYRKELLPEVYAAIQDAGQSLEDLMAAFPNILKIERNRLALALVRNRKRLNAIRDQQAIILRHMAESPAVDPAATKALSRFDEYLTDEENIDIVAQALGDKTLAMRNAIAAGYRAVRRHPATRMGLLALLGVIATPLRKTAEAVPALKPLHDRLVEELAEKANGEPLPKAEPARQEATAAAPASKGSAGRTKSSEKPATPRNRRRPSSSTAGEPAPAEEGDAPPDED